MNAKQIFPRITRLLCCCIFLLVTTQHGLAQDSTSDSLVKSSRLYQKGKKNATFGATFLGIGLAGTLVGLVIKEKETTGWNFGPSDKEAVYFISALFGTIGILKLIQGGVRMQKARAELGTVLYHRLPGQKAQMPVVRMQLSLSENLLVKKKARRNTLAW